MISLAGKTAVVTGAGRGIGAACARALAGAGARVVLGARTRNSVERVAAELRTLGHEAAATVSDVTDPASVDALARFSAERFGEVTLLVNNAGIGHAAPLERLTLDDWNRVMAVNATGTFLCTKAFLPAMVKRGWGRVVNVASVAGLSGGRYIAAYAASKHAVVGFTRCAALEVAGAGVTVNAVCPGYVDTEMTRESLERIAMKTGRSREQALEAVLTGTPQSRLITPDEVAFEVLRLCAEDAREINGQTIVLDGAGLT
ncbi:MAG TPA: SDR family NAD(P)-dependent oxidoreductase [Gemmatimonadales bacterium]|nr:SDR family NAD(P)-dependent oxidoreductase [Gemmatimonadales bacterium]